MYYYIYLFMHVFICLCWVLVAGCKILVSSQLGSLVMAHGLSSCATERPVNPRKEVERQGTRLSWTVGWEDGRVMSQSNHVVRVWMTGSFIEPEGEKLWETKVKRQNRELETLRKQSKKGLQFCRTCQDGPAFGMCVLISSFHSWAESVHLPVNWEKAR